MVLALHDSEDIVHVINELVLLVLDAEEGRHLALEVSNDEGMHPHVPRPLYQVVDLLWID